MMKGAANTRPRYITMGQRTDCFTSCSDRNCPEPFNREFSKHTFMKMFLAQSGAQGVSLSVQHKFVYSSEFSSFSHRSVSGKSQVSPRSVPGQSQVSLRSVSGISVPTSSDRWSLKYFILFKVRYVTSNLVFSALIGPN